MSIQAAKTFITAVQATRKDFDQKTAAYYAKFIKPGGHKPTAADVANLKTIVDQMDQIGKFYHGNVRPSIEGFGGSGDHAIMNAKELLQSIQKLAQS